MEPKKLTEPQVRLMIFLSCHKKKYTRSKLIPILDIDRTQLSLAIKPLAGYFIQVEKQKKKTVGRKGDLISLTEAGKIAIHAWKVANK